MSVNAALLISLQTQTGATLSGSDNEAGTLITTTLGQPIAFSANSNSFPFTLSLTQANAQLVYLCATSNCTITTNNTNTPDVQTFTLTGTPTGGSFPVAWNANGTIVATSVPFNANAATLQTQLQLLVGNGNVNCNGAGAFPGNSINATFAGTLNTGKQPVFVVSNAALTGGTNSNVTVTHAVTGAPTDTINLVAGIPRVWGASQGYGSCPFTGNVNGAFMTCNAATLLNVGLLTN